MTAKTLPAHGTLSRHKHYGCNCQPCHSHYRAYENRRNRLRGYGTWQPLIDATPARQHITNLVAEGYTLRSIWQAANTDAATLQRILYGPNKTLRAETAARLLAVTAEQLTPSTHRTVDATGTRRRIQALVAIGWPLTHIGHQLGIHPRPLTDLTRVQRVTRGTAQRIETGYRRLSGLDPTIHGVPRNHATAARRTAAARGWHGPLAWDDIDDPEALPEVDGVTTLHPHKRRATAADITAEVTHLAGCGESIHSIAKALGRSESRIAQLLPPNYGEAA